MKQHIFQFIITHYQLDIIISSPIIYFFFPFLLLNVFFFFFFCYIPQFPEGFDSFFYCYNLNVRLLNSSKKNLNKNKYSREANENDKMSTNANLIYDSRLFSKGFLFFLNVICSCCNKFCMINSELKETNDKSYIGKVFFCKLIFRGQNMPFCLQHIQFKCKYQKARYACICAQQLKQFKISCCCCCVYVIYVMCE